MVKGDVIELENCKKYAVAEIIEINYTKYLYLINIEDNSDIVFAQFDEDEINIVYDENVYSDLMIEVAKKQSI